MWTCPKCGTKVDSALEVCWFCGTTPDGVEDPTFVPADAASPPVSPLDLDMPKGDEPIPEPATPLSGDLVECYWALDLMQAKFLADQLTENGIPAVADMHDALGSISSRPRVWVRAEDLPRARAWLEAYDQQYKAEHGRVE
jgi:Putative prokaryotic signal transducing protein